MTRCIKLFGHKWGKWDTDGLGAVVEGLDGKLYRQLVQSRACETCNLKDVNWLPEYNQVSNDTDAPGDDEEATDA